MTTSMELPDSKFFLQAKFCKKALVDVGKACTACTGLESNVVYQGIVDHIQWGMGENTPFTYQPIGGLMNLLQQRVDQVQALHLIKVNNHCKLAGRAAALEDHKQWILAVVSGKVDRVVALVKAGLKNHAGIWGLIAEYERVMLKLYCLQGYTEEDIMRVIVILQLGGARVAKFAHKSMALPSPRTARQNAII